MSEARAILVGLKVECINEKIKYDQSSKNITHAILQP